MYTQCPHCQAYFEVSADQLKVGDGDVRCGQCLSIFHALSYLSESLPEPAENEAQKAPVHQEPELGDIDSIANDAELWAEPEQNDEQRNAASADDTVHASAHAAVAEPIHDTAHEHHGDREERTADVPATDSDSLAEDAATARPEEPAPTMATETVATPVEPAREIYAEQIIDPEPQPPTHDEPGSAEPAEGPTSHLPAPLLRQLQEEKAASLRPPATPWVIGSLLMLLVFLAQASYFYRDELAQRQPELRPWLEQACGYLDCKLRRPVTQAKIDILGWDVRTLPDTPQALLASTTLVNKSPTPQPYPLLTLRFSDINGAPLAQRRFLPREYLPANTDLKAGMQPDTPLLVELALVDPGKQAVNFEFHTEPSHRTP